MPKNSVNIEALRRAILIQHECMATHRKTVFVREETSENETVWEGNVDVFDLTGHSDAKTCYSWQHLKDNGEVRIFAILGNEFIDSANKAVQAAIFVDKQPPSPSSRTKPQRYLPDNSLGILPTIPMYVLNPSLVAR